VTLTSTLTLASGITVGLTAGEGRRGICGAQLTANKSDSNPIVPAMWLRLIMYVFGPLFPDTFQSASTISHSMNYTTNTAAWLF
jgi:hypothetical protein